MHVKLCSVAAIGALIGCSPQAEVVDQGSLNFENCLSAAQDTQRRIGVAPVVLVNEPGRRVFEFRAQDGAVRIICDAEDGYAIETI